MKTTYLFVIISVVISITYDIPIAGNLQYKCRVIHTYDLENDGSLKDSNWNKEFKGSEFIVSRATGEIVGKLLLTSEANSTKVINKGNESWSFKSIAEFDAVNKPFSSGMEDAVSTASFHYSKFKSLKRGMLNRLLLCP